MRVVIFGSDGMLGGELAKAFSEAEVLTPRLKDVDITQEDVVGRYVFDARPELVINAAAYNFMDQAETMPGYLKAMMVNGRAPAFIARAARLIGAPVIHYSTDQVFAREERAGFAEDDPPGPAERLSAYGRSKLLGEKLLRGEAEKFYVIRTSRLFGRQGASPLAKKSFAELFLEKARSDFVLNAVNEEMASSAYAPDLARATRELWQDRVPWGVYHLVNEGSATWYQLAKAVVALAQKGALVRAVSARVFERPAFRPRFSVLLNTKRPKLRPWQEALAEYLRSRL